MISQKERLALHKAIQRVIGKQIGFDKVKIEHPFPNHFADLYWPEKSLVIEIQCSPISLEEVLKRNRDYEKLGLDIVWILHQKSFNRKTLTASERYLRTRCALYTNIFTNGTGVIYDQHEVIDGHLRLYKSPPYTIDITTPKKISWAKSYLMRWKIDALWSLGNRGIVFDGNCKTRPFWDQLTQLHIACKLKPFYKRIEYGESSTRKFACLFLKCGHALGLATLFLLLQWKKSRDTFLGNKNTQEYTRRQKKRSSSLIGNCLSAIDKGSFPCPLVKYQTLIESLSIASLAYLAAA